MGTGFDVMALLPFVLIFGVFYFLILRPQQQKLKKHQNILANLRRGDRVVTTGGLIGTISKIVDESEVQLEIGDNVRIRQVRGMIAEVLAKTDPVSTTQSSKTPVSADRGVVSPIVRKTGASTAKKATKPAANRSTEKSKK
jgi:preprotein translocase subunit YajC